MPHDPVSYHMSPDDLRHHGNEVLEWIAHYHAQIEQYPVLSPSSPGDVRSKLPRSAPERGEPFSSILRDLDDIIKPGLTHWQSPNFFAFYPTGISGPSILADLVSSGLGVQGMLWATSPAATELESHVLDWLVELMGLPLAFLSTSTGGGVILDTASSAALCAAVAARERATNFSTNRSGISGGLRAYVSSHSHSSVIKSLKIAGYGEENIVRIDVDDSFAMKPDHLEAAMREDKERGLVPAFVCGTTGTTSSMAMDPLAAVGALCRKHGAWFHVDAAMAGTATICPEFRHLNEGLDAADSYCFNPHKWMLTNFDCDCFYVSDRSILISSLSILPEYLRNRTSETGAVTDYRDWQVPLGRRFRSLKLWFVLRHYGIEGLQYHIRRHVELAQEFSAWVVASEHFELLAPSPLNLICFAHTQGNARTEAILDHVNGSGKMYVSHAVLNDRFAIRLCVGQAWTEREHVEAAWSLLLRAAEATERT